MNINSETISSHKEINEIKQRLKDNYIQFWEKEIGYGLGNEGKLCTYRKFKTKFIYENYLDLITRSEHRKAMTQFRISAHRLEIELGRHSNTPGKNGYVLGAILL